MDLTEEFELYCKTLSKIEATAKKAQPSLFLVQANEVVSTFNLTFFQDEKKKIYSFLKLFPMSNCSEKVMKDLLEFTGNGCLLF